MIPVNTPLLNGREKELLIECIETGWISSDGPFVKEFEDKFSARIGRKYGVAVANGSAALDIAVAALRITSGDEVIMPTFTIISPAASVVRAGGVPVLIDSDPVTWNMDVSQIEPKITSKTKAIIIVHIYGLTANIGPILELAKKYNLKIIEDAAEMHGQTYNGKMCGTFGDISIFSFYPNKHITTGEGGMVLTDDEELMERSRSFRNLCFLPEKRFVHNELGWNYRMTNMQAALGVAQLERLDEFVDKKRKMGEFYRRLLEGVPGILLPPVKTEYCENIYWVFGMLLDDTIPFDAEEMIGKLGEKKIGSRPFFWPMHEQPVFINQGMFKGEHYPIAEKIARRGFYIPSGLSLTEGEMEDSAKAIKQILLEKK